MYNVCMRTYVYSLFQVFQYYIIIYVQRTLYHLYTADYLTYYEVACPCVGRTCQTTRSAAGLYRRACPVHTSFRTVQSTLHFSHEKKCSNDLAMRKNATCVTGHTWDVMERGWNLFFNLFVVKTWKIKGPPARCSFCLPILFKICYRIRQ